jgi:hypothetical protein
MKPALIVAFLWLLFAGPHIGLATSRVRGFLVERLGVWGFAYLFSAVAAVTFSLLVHYYAGARFDGVAGLDLARFTAFRYVAIGAIVLAFVLMIGRCGASRHRRCRASTRAPLSREAWSASRVIRFSSEPGCSA